MRFSALLPALLIGVAAPMLGGCALKPVYAGGASGAVAQGLAAVEVSAIPGKNGWLMRDALQQRMGSAGAATSRYRLDVVLDDQLKGLGLLGDDTIGRERRTLRARYRLVDLDSGETLLDATAGSDAGIDVVSSEYATIAAEQAALENLTVDVADKIVTSLSMTLRQR